MQRRKALVALSVGLWLLAGALWAGADEPRGESRARFLRLIEKQVGQREVLGIVVQDLKSDREATLLFGRDSKVAGRARKLRQGQVVALRYVTERGQQWLTAVEAVGEDEARREGKPRREGETRREDKAHAKDKPRREGEGRREGDRPRKGEARRDREREPGEALAAVRKLAQRVERLERQVRELQAENARLRRHLGLKAREGERREGEGRRDREEGEGRRRGPRDGEGPAKVGPRDGEGPAKVGPKDV